jgi:hypothetical protein
LDKTPEHEGQSRRLDVFGLGAQFAQKRASVVRDLFDVGPAFGIHAHRRNFDQSGQFLLELAPQTGAAAAQILS